MAAAQLTAASMSCAHALLPNRASTSAAAPARSFRSSFSGLRLAVPVQRCQQRKALAAAPRAFQRMYPDPQFIKETLEAFPEKGVANVEEARVLFSEGGYIYLDVRPTLELEEVGKVRGSINVPIKNAKKSYDPVEKKKVFIKSDNPDFINQVKKRIPNKEAKILIGCSNGRAYSMDALMALDEEGYTNICGLKGGYYAWFKVFTHKLTRRVTGEYAENVTHDGDSCGIHSSGAGFAKVDKADQWVPPSF